MKISTVRRKLRRDKDFFARLDEDGISLVHRFAWNNWHEHLKIILEAGADPNIVDKNGETPLHGAVGSESLESCQLLLEHGANPLAEDCNGLTPYYWLEKYPNDAIKALFPPPTKTEPRKVSNK